MPPKRSMDEMPALRPMYQEIEPIANQAAPLCRSRDCSYAGYERPITEAGKSHTNADRGRHDSTRNLNSRERDEAQMPLQDRNMLHA